MNTKITQAVSKIIQNVIKNGDKALSDYTKKFDGVALLPQNFKVPLKTIKESALKIDKSLKASIDFAYKNVKKFHDNEYKNIKKSWNVENGDIITGQKYNAIESIGIYVPGGRFSYPSSVIMSAVPAKCAGVKRIVMVTPPAKMTDAVLYAAKICGITEIYTVGGAQAIAALAYGTKTIKGVNMIVGPGNAYVNEAKRLVFGKVGIDSLAGPSEVAIIADSGADAEFIVADILAQAEHDPMALAYLFTDSKQKFDEVKKKLPKEIKSQVKIEYCSQNQAVEFVNDIAPEHLELLVKNPSVLAAKIHNAGAVFMGYNTPTALGDYTAGPSHVLPTEANAKFSSGLSVMTFLKRISYTQVKNSKNKIYAHTQTFANAEGLEHHARSAIIRGKK
ncbi:MAG: histidinol dehydrogenase [Elusimicrobia bacterium]|nr:histidinol dehydrogenase [Elusimicrobiota bacterium]